MKTALWVGGGAVALYLAWRYYQAHATGLLPGGSNMFGPAATANTGGAGTAGGLLAGLSAPASTSSPLVGPISSPIFGGSGGTERPLATRIGGGPIAIWTKNLVPLPKPLTTTQLGFATNTSKTTTVGPAVLGPKVNPSPVLSGLQLGTSGKTSNGVIAL